ncbi:MAG: hypothetical protein ACREJC_06075, partial [Tepidisphaeraceae bacterium]
MKPVWVGEATLLVRVLLSTGCYLGNHQTYPGPKLPPERVATINRARVLKSVDGTQEIILNQNTT